MSKHQHFNRLSPAEAERLAILVEELGESLQMIGKILRHGFESSNPLSTGPVNTNRDLLEAELGHVKHAIDRLANNGDLSLEKITQSAEKKSLTISRWLHHQEDPTSGN